MLGMKREWPVLEDVLRSAFAWSPIESSVPARSRGEAAAEAACFCGWWTVDATRKRCHRALASALALVLALELEFAVALALASDSVSVSERQLER